MTLGQLIMPLASRLGLRDYLELVEAYSEQKQRTARVEGRYRFFDSGKLSTLLIVPSTYHPKFERSIWNVAQQPGSVPT